MRVHWTVAAWIIVLLAVTTHALLFYEKKIAIRVLVYYALITFLFVAISRITSTSEKYAAYSSDKKMKIGLVCLFVFLLTITVQWSFPQLLKWYFER